MRRELQTLVIEAPPGPTGPYKIPENVTRGRVLAAQIAIACGATAGDRSLILTCEPRELVLGSAPVRPRWQVGIVSTTINTEWRATFANFGQAQTALISAALKLSMVNAGWMDFLGGDQVVFDVATQAGDTVSWIVATAEYEFED